MSLNSSDPHCLVTPQDESDSKFLLAILRDLCSRGAVDCVGLVRDTHRCGLFKSASNADVTVALGACPTPSGVAHRQNRRTEDI